MQFVYFAMYVVVGIALDWAMVWRLNNFFIGQAAESYFGLAYPRMIVTLAGITLIFIAGAGNDVNTYLLISGVILFCLSLGYAFYRLATGKERM